MTIQEIQEAIARLEKHGVWRVRCHEDDVVLIYVDNDRPIGTICPIASVGSQQETVDGVIDVTTVPALVACVMKHGRSMLEALEEIRGRAKVAAEMLERHLTDEMGDLDQVHTLMLEIEEEAGRAASDAVDVEML